jgi:hypothetical protein
MSKDPWRDDTNGRKDREVVVRQVGVGDLECVVVVVDSFLHKTHLVFCFFSLEERRLLCRFRSCESFARPALYGAMLPGVVQQDQLCYNKLSARTVTVSRRVVSFGK